MSVKVGRFGLRAGWGVSLVLREPVAGLHCYVGKIQHIDDYGVRVTLIDWIVGMFTGMDLALPWDNIIAAQVCTDQHSWEMWMPEKWQNRCEKDRKVSPASERSPSAGQTIELEEAR